MKFGSVARVNPFKPTSKDPSGSLSRHSSGFDQFCAALQVPEGGMSVLDMSGASQANIVFLTSFGHRVSSDDIMAAMQQSFGDNFHENQQSASNAQRFLDQALAFPDNSFDGILVWDALQFLVPPLIDQVVAQFLRIMRPKGVMLTFFSASEKASTLPIYSYRITDRKTLSLTPRAAAQRIQYYNNRFVEKLFENASSVKFFLTRDHLREVLVRK
ncbi:MAG TPA: class I SAM-dependent methyltransferase [Bryobacteraceae bacterium]|nr:class I SAM-dependent methyltransferase [Bryobacteraceae bacterium]